MTIAVKSSTVFAGAKVNLTLRVICRRADGFHALDSLVVHTADLGDKLSFTVANGLSLTCDGPFGAYLTAEDDNLILKAARALGVKNAAFTLTKNLPVASGIGGGSADAAAALNLLNKTLNLGHDRRALGKIGVTLGADVPMCLHPGPKRVSGLGDVIEHVALPPFHLVLVNPGIAVPTAAVFQRLKTFSAPPTAPPTRFDDLVGWIEKTGNDLLPPAISLAPPIGAVLKMLAQQSAVRASGMSGSGATCFGLFETRAAAENAATSLRAAQPDWWCQAATTAGEQHGSH